MHSGPPQSRAGGFILPRSARGIAPLAGPASPVGGTSDRTRRACSSSTNLGSRERLSQRSRVPTSVFRSSTSPRGFRSMPLVPGRARWRAASSDPVGCDSPARTRGGLDGRAARAQPVSHNVLYEGPTVAHYSIEPATKASLCLRASRGHRSLHRHRRDAGTALPRPASDPAVRERESTVRRAYQRIEQGDTAPRRRS